MIEKKYHCSVCGKEISDDEYINHEEMCLDCWDDQMTEEDWMI